MRIEFKRASSVEVDHEGKIQALVAVTGNVDRGGDVILPGAFTKTLSDWQASDRPIPLVLSHNWNEPGALLGEVTKAEETGEGLVVDASLDLEFPPVAHVFRRMQAKSLAEFSIGFIAREFAFLETDSGEIVRELKEIELLECGPCIAGQNPETRLIDLKSLEKDDIIEVLVERLAKKIQENAIGRIPAGQKALVSAWTARLARTR
jgi:phage prohead protease, HK97 family